MVCVIHRRAHMYGVPSGMCVVEHHCARLLIIVGGCRAGGGGAGVVDVMDARESVVCAVAACGVVCACCVAGCMAIWSRRKWSCRMGSVVAVSAGCHGACHRSVCHAWQPHAPIAPPQRLVHRWERAHARTCHAQVCHAMSSVVPRTPWPGADCTSWHRPARAWLCT